MNRFRLAQQAKIGLRVFSAGSYVIFYAPVDNGIEVQRVIHGARDIGSLY